MPSISFSFKDLCNLIGEKISLEQLEKFVSYGKGELESYDKEAEEVCISFGDTNLPYLWSVEGVARLIKGLIKKEKGIPKIDIFRKSEYSLIVEKSVLNTRPYIAAFVALGCKVNDYLIKQLIDLQEKFCESYGRKRKKVAIGIYNQRKIKFPVHYKATDPESIKFIPLEFRKEMTQQEILEEHPKGKEYALILEGFDKYPLLIDNNGKVLSFPPIINSNYSGMIEINDEDLFFEATGEDLDSVLLAANIFAQALFERGFKIYSVDCIYPDKKVISPCFFNESIRISNGQIKSLTGLELKEEEIKKLLEKMRYNYNKGKVEIPFYRKDIMHPNDVIEDIAISYGYDNISSLPLKTATIGSIFEITKFIDKIREFIIGFGYQEVMSPILSNKEILYEKMNIEDYGYVEIKEFMSERYSVVRTWILPILMDVLSKNKSVEYPQKIFEEGLVSVRRGEEIKDYHRIAAVSAYAEAGYTEARQLLDALFRAFGIKYSVEETEHSSFIEGRVGRVIVNNKKVAYIGELNPKVLENFDLTVPAAGFELNLTELFQILE